MTTVKPEHLLISKAGFTLLEIAIAIFILAGSMVALLSLQSAALERAVRDRQKQQAMLIARTVLAELEAGMQTTEIGTQEFTAKDLFGKHGSTINAADFKGVDLEQLRINLVTASWKLPIPTSSGLPNEVALKRIDLRVAWGEAARDRIEVVYFLPDDEDEENY